MNDLIYHDLVDFERYESETAPEMGKGLVERDLEAHPYGCYGAAPESPTEITVYPRSEWPERIRDMEATKSRLSDIRATGKFGQRIPSLNQGNIPYCWAHGPTMAVILLRAVANMPYVPLSACSVGCLALDWKISGAWSALALDTIRTIGIADEKYWPQRSLARTNDNERTRKNMAMHRADEVWQELNKAAYDRKLTFEQKMSLLMDRIPVCNDYYWWGHAVVSMDPVNMNAVRDEIRDDDSGKLMAASQFDAQFGVGGEADGYGSRDLNSWGDDWGSNGGEVVIAGNRAIPSGAVAPRTVSLV